jgi:AcrR family transcriptional regulator
MTDFEIASTRERLMLTAERLFAEQGLESVSLRQISAVAGQRNKFAVQYHFGSKEELLDAVFAHRLPRIERARTEMLADLTRSGAVPTLRQLLDLIFAPLAREALDAESRYVSFVTRVTVYGPVARSWWSRDGDTAVPFGPISMQLNMMLEERLQQLPTRVRRSRLHAMFTGCLTALAVIDEHATNTPADDGGIELAFDARVVDLLDMAAASLTAPVSQAVLNAAEEDD